MDGSKIGFSRALHTRSTGKLIGGLDILALLQHDAQQRVLKVAVAHLDNIRLDALDEVIVFAQGRNLLFHGLHGRRVHVLNGGIELGQCVAGFQPLDDFLGGQRRQGRLEQLPECIEADGRVEANICQLPGGIGFCRACHCRRPLTFGVEVLEV